MPAQSIPRRAGPRQHPSRWASVPAGWPRICSRCPVPWSWYGTDTRSMPRELFLRAGPSFPYRNRSRRWSSGASCSLAKRAPMTWCPARHCPRHRSPPSASSWAWRAIMVSSPTARVIATRTTTTRCTSTGRTCRAPILEAALPSRCCRRASGRPRGDRTRSTSTASGAVGAAAGGWARATPPGSGCWCCAGGCGTARRCCRPASSSN